MRWSLDRSGTLGRFLLIISFMFFNLRYRGIAGIRSVCCGFLRRLLVRWVACSLVHIVEGRL